MQANERLPLRAETDAAVCWTAFPLFPFGVACSNPILGQKWVRRRIWAGKLEVVIVFLLYEGERRFIKILNTEHCVPLHIIPNRFEVQR